MTTPRGFEAYNKFIKGIRELKQIYDFTYHLYLKENKRLLPLLPKDKKVITINTSVGAIDHSLTALYQRSKNVYPYRLRQLLLISSITNLEVFLVDCLREAFERDTSKFSDDLILEFQRGFLLNTPSIKRLQETIINKDIRTLTSGGLTIIKKYYKKNFKIDFENIGIKYNDVEEIHIRRHLHVHRNGICDLDYSKKYPKHSFKPGDYIKIEHQYFLDSLQIIQEFGTKINSNMIAQFPLNLRGIKYFKGNATQKAGDKILLLEIDILKSKYDHVNYFKKLKVYELNFLDYLVQINTIDQRCILIISGEDSTLNRFFKPMKANNNIEINNITELNLE